MVLDVLCLAVGEGSVPVRPRRSPSVPVSRPGAPPAPGGDLPRVESGSAGGTAAPGSPRASARASPLRFCGAGPGAAGRHLPGPRPGVRRLLRGAHRPHRQRGRGRRGRADTGSRPGAAGLRRGSRLPGLSQCGAVPLSGRFQGVHGWEPGRVWGGGRRRFRAGRRPAGLRRVARAARFLLPPPWPPARRARRSAGSRAGPGAPRPGAPQPQAAGTRAAPCRSARRSPTPGAGTARS